MRSVAFPIIRKDIRRLSMMYRIECRNTQTLHNLSSSCLSLFSLLHSLFHEYLYKKNLPDSIGKEIHNKYECGLVKNKNDFEEVLKDVLSDMESRYSMKGIL